MEQGFAYSKSVVYCSFQCSLQFLCEQVLYLLKKSELAIDMDIDLFVTEVNSLPLLWNSSDVDYKDRNKKVSSVSSH